MKTKYETMIEHLKLLSNMEVLDSDTDFGENVHDAYEAGAEFAEQRLAYYILAVLEENNNKND